MIIHIEANIHGDYATMRDMARQAATIARFDFDHFDAVAQNGLGQMTITATPDDRNGTFFVTIDFVELGHGQGSLHGIRRSNDAPLRITDAPGRYGFLADR